MMETVRIETDARGVARLTLARSEKRNAMSAAMIGELTEAAAMLGIGERTLYRKIKEYGLTSS